MAKIRDANPKNPSGGFDRLFDDADLGGLMSKVQSTVIANGSELERVIMERAPGVADLTRALEDPASLPEGTYLVPKKQMKRAELCRIHTISGDGTRVRLPEPDFLLLTVGRVCRCDVVELKDGHVFDTKKSQAERDNLVKYAQQLGSRLPYITTYHICCFNQEDPEEIRRGLKNVFQPEEILTGRAFCRALGIDYDAIRRDREEDARDNVSFFFEELARLPVTARYFRRREDGGD